MSFSFVSATFRAKVTALFVLELFAFFCMLSYDLCFIYIFFLKMAFDFFKEISDKYLDFQEGFSFFFVCVYIYMILKVRF